MKPIFNDSDVESVTLKKKSQEFWLSKVISAANEKAALFDF